MAVVISTCHDAVAHCEEHPDRFLTSKSNWPQLPFSKVIVAYRWEKHHSEHAIEIERQLLYFCFVFVIMPKDNSSPFVSGNTYRLILLRLPIQ